MQAEPIVATQSRAMPLTVGVSADFQALGTAVTQPIEETLAQASDRVAFRYFAATGRDADGLYVTADDAAGLDGVVLLGYRFRADSLDAESTLAAIGRWGVGYDTLDVPALTRGGCLLAITPEGVRRPVAEAILTLMLALAKQLFAKDAIARHGPWRARHEPWSLGLEGKVVGSVGLGNIGTDLFRLLAPFHCGRLLAHDPYGDAQQAAALGVELVPLEALLAASDFVSLNCPLTDATYHLIDAPRLALMKKTAFLINTARGPVVDQDALVAALQQGAIAGAGLDVQVPEPLPPDSPLAALPNVILAPHTLAWTDQLYALNGAGAARNVLAVLEGRIPAATVNRDVLRNPRFQAKQARFAAYGVQA